MAKKKAAKKKVKKAKKPKLSAKKRVLKKKAAPKRKTPRRRKKSRGKTYSFEQAEYSPVQSRRSGKAGQSGDLQGLSDVEEADSESVDELLEEGQRMLRMLIGVPCARTKFQRTMFPRNIARKTEAM